MAIVFGYPFDGKDGHVLQVYKKKYTVGSWGCYTPCSRLAQPVCWGKDLVCWQ